MSPTAASQKWTAPSWVAKVAWSSRIAPAASGPSRPSSPGPCWVTRMEGVIDKRGMPAIAVITSGGGGATSRSVMSSPPHYHPSATRFNKVNVG